MKVKIEVIVGVVVGALVLLTVDILFARPARSVVGRVQSLQHVAGSVQTVVDANGNPVFITQPAQWSVVLVLPDRVVSTRVAPKLWVRLRPGEDVEVQEMEGLLSGMRVGYSVSGVSTR